MPFESAGGVVFREPVDAGIRVFVMMREESEGYVDLGIRSAVKGEVAYGFSGARLRGVLEMLWI